MPCGAVFQNITGISKKKTIEYTEEELELLDKRRQDIDIEFKILEREKGCKIYPHQKKAGRYIVDCLNGESLINMMAIAPTQSGKTGILIEVVRLFIKETNISYKNIYIITGLSSVEWKKQTKERLPDKLKKRVYHRCDLNRAFYKDIERKKDILIIMDEIQIASAKDQTIHKVFDELNFMKLETLLKKNIKMLEITATPNGSIYELMKWGEEFSKKIIIEAPAEYTSCFKLFDENRVFQYKDLCDDIIDDKKLIKAIDNINELKDIINEYYVEDPRFHFIRTKAAESQEKTKNNFKQVFGDGIKIIEFDMEHKETDINKIVNKKPDENTFIFVKEKLRCAKTIENKHLVGVYYERYTGSIPDDDVIIQGMLGRATGYNDNGDSIIFTHIPSIEKYKKLLLSEFNDRTINWASSSTIMKNKKIRGINFFNSPDNIKGFKVVEYDDDIETREEKKERIAKQKIEREERKQVKELEKEEKQKEKEAKQIEREAKQKERDAMKKAKESLKEQQKKEKEQLKEQLNKSKDAKKTKKGKNESKSSNKKEENEKPKPKKTKKANDDDEIEKSKSKDDEKEKEENPFQGDPTGTDNEEQIKKWKTSFRLKIKNELSSYANEYEKLNKKSIDQVYLSTCLKNICSKTFEDNFDEVCNEQGDPKTWEKDVFRAFISEFSDLYTKYPLENEENEEEVKEPEQEQEPEQEPEQEIKRSQIIDEDEIPEVQPKKKKLRKLNKKFLEDEE